MSSAPSPCVPTHRIHFGGKVQDQVVLMVRAVMHRTRHVYQQASLTVLGRFRDHVDVGVRLLAPHLNKSSKTA
jgi:hypothetical protein